MRADKPKVRNVLLDAGFVNALLATDAPEHAAAIDLYRQLVDNSAAGLDRLFALSNVLGDLPREFRRGALAPVLRVHVSRQHRHAAGKITATPSDHTALSLVLMRRERIRTVATTSHEFDAFDVEVLSVAPDVEARAHDSIPAGYVGYEAAPEAVPDPALSSGTEPPLAPLSTDE